MGWQGRARASAADRGVAKCQAVLDVCKFSTISSRNTSSLLVHYVLGRLRGRCWGGSVDDDWLIFRRPFGWRIADARTENVVHVNATFPNALLLDLAGGSGVEVAVKPTLGGWLAGRYRGQNRGTLNT